MGNAKFEGFPKDCEARVVQLDIVVSVSWPHTLQLYNHTSGSGAGSREWLSRLVVSSIRLHRLIVELESTYILVISLMMCLPYLLDGFQIGSFKGHVHWLGRLNLFDHGKDVHPSTGAAESDS